MFLSRLENCRIHCAQKAKHHCSCWGNKVPQLAIFHAVLFISKCTVLYSFNISNVCFCRAEQTNKNKQQLEAYSPFESKHCLFLNLIYSLNSSVIILSKMLPFTKDNASLPTQSVQLFTLLFLPRLYGVPLKKV